MSRGPEAAFWKRVRRAWRGHSIRIEASDGEVDPGTPDTILSIAYRGGFVELKVWPDNVSGVQLAWHEDAVQRGAYAMVLCDLNYRGQVWIGPASEFDRLHQGKTAYERYAKALSEGIGLQAALRMIECGLTRSVEKKPTNK